MQRILLAAVLLGLAPLAYAQTTPSPNTTTQPLSTKTAKATTGENCGTPDEFKPCPPLPRVPLATYPANKP